MASSFLLIVGAQGGKGGVLRDDPTLSLEDLKKQSPDTPLQAPSPYKQSADRTLVDARKPDAQLVEYNRQVRRPCDLPQAPFKPCS